MGTETLSPVGFIGNFYQALEAEFGKTWLPEIGMMFNSDHESEFYPWIGMSPMLREWIGGRQPKGFLQNGITIHNKHFEATLEFLIKDFRRDKTGQIMVRINDLAQRANAHWASLISTLMLNGAATVCYDGQYFFDTDHSEGASGSQSNKINVDISELPVLVKGSTTAPSVEQMQQAVLNGIVQILSLLDDQAEPMNELAKNFRVMVPPSLAFVGMNAINPATMTGVTVQGTRDINVNLSVNARLTSWTTDFVVLRTDGQVKPFVLQQETPVQMKLKGEGSDFAFDNDAYQYGIDTWRNVGYGYWQHACKVTMT
jgi:phage major head subunit gpT-like protein